MTCTKCITGLLVIEEYSDAATIEVAKFWKCLNCSYQFDALTLTNRAKPPNPKFREHMNRRPHHKSRGVSGAKLSQPLAMQGAKHAR